MAAFSGAVTPVGMSDAACSSPHCREETRGIKTLLALLPQPLSFTAAHHGPMQPEAGRQRNLLVKSMQVSLLGQKAGWRKVKSGPGGAHRRGPYTVTLFPELPQRSVLNLFLALSIFSGNYQLTFLSPHYTAGSLRAGNMSCSLLQSQTTHNVDP